MAMKRVIAHVMHETELAAAANEMQNPIATEAFVIGEIDESKIQDLESKGIIVAPLEDAPPEEDPAEVEALGAGQETGPYHIAQLSGPLVGSRLGDLEAAGGEVIEALGQDRLVLRIAEGKNDAVKDLLFVRSLRVYGSKDTEMVMQPTGLSGINPTPENAAKPDEIEVMGAAEGPQAQCEIRLHKGDDLPALVTWLEQQGIQVTAHGRSKVRIALAPDHPKVGSIRSRTEVAAMEEYVEPTLFNDHARALIGLENPGPPVTRQIPQTGAGQIVGIADTGLDTKHPDFPAARVRKLIARGRPGKTDDPSGHGTHVTGSAVGDGSASAGLFAGIAPAASIVFQSLLDANHRLGGLPANLYDLFLEAYNENVRIHNNSWGADTTAHYRLTSREVDEFVWDHPDMLLVFAAGNAGSEETPPGPSRTGAGNVDWLSVGSPATAKNALTVGAQRSDRTSGGYAHLTYGTQWGHKFRNPKIASEKISGDASCLAAFSSRGPCIDNRIKPDIVAPGTDIASAKSSLAGHGWGPVAGQPNYCYMGGTSMAAPIVAGAAALVREFYQQATPEKQAHTPSAALLKATLINGTEPLTGWDATHLPNTPNYHQGFGSLCLPSTIPNDTVSWMRLHFEDLWQNPAQNFTAAGQRRRFTITVNGGNELRICMVYTDLPGAGRQNHLNLFVQQPDGSKIGGNVDLPHNHLRVPDPYNNVQVIRIPNATAGQYLIQISATNILAPQSFALVVTGDTHGALAKIS